MRRIVIALVLATVWSAGLIVAAAVAPAYRSSSSSVSVSSAGGPVTVEGPTETSTSTLLAENGPSVLAVVGLPLLAVGAVAAALRHRRRRARSGAGPFAWIVVGLLGTLTFLGMMTIGIFLLPTLGLLCFACGSASAQQPPRPCLHRDAARA
jgi:hypothetical protein